MSVREKLNDKVGIGVGIALLAIAAVVIGYYYFSTAHFRPNVTQAYFTDDDGHSYYKGSIYNFPPYDHDGKTAEMVILGVSNGSRSVALLMRYTSAARQELQKKYDDAVKNGLPVQETVLGFMHTSQIANNMEVKLPGSGDNWVPKSQMGTLNVKAPNGQDFDDYVEQP
jgi:hypothetical protein